MFVHIAILALHLAAELGYPEIVELLLAEGAVVDAKDKGGYTALAGAARKGPRGGVGPDVARLPCRVENDLA